MDENDEAVLFWRDLNERMNQVVRDAYTRGFKAGVEQSQINLDAGYPLPSTDERWTSPNGL